MKIYSKLTLSLMFLFVVILLLSGVGIYYLQQLANDSEAIIKNNYRTLVYMENQDRALDNLIESLSVAPLNEASLREIDSAQQLFEQNLHLQLRNVTEPGEKQLSRTLENDYEKLSLSIKTYLSDPQFDYYALKVIPKIISLKEQIDYIYSLNEETLLEKNELAKRTGEKVVLYMAIFSISAIILGLLFMIGIPIYISKPIRRFNIAILEIAKGNYEVQLPIHSKDEFGQLARSFNKMVAKLKEYEHSNYARILFEKKRIDAIANQMQEAIIGLDENKNIIFINRRALKLTGLNRARILGQYAPDIAVRNNLMQELIAELMIGFESWEERVYKPVEIIEDDHEKLFTKSIIDITGKQTGEDRQVLIGHVILLTDVTEYAEKELAKTHFMATLSHELKTPAAAIQMSANLLRNDKVGELNAEQFELLNTITENNERIQRTIREILDLSKIESGTIDVSKEEVDPAPVIAKAIEGVVLFLKDKHIQIKRKGAQNLPLISVDPHKTIWVLNNFLTNAIRYSPEGATIVINAEEKGNQLVISVKDEGLGISMENQKAIFKKFSRVADDKTKGTGLGLAISKEFIEAMEGSIGVSSSEGEGSTFWVQFPIKRS